MYDLREHLAQSDAALLPSFLHHDVVVPNTKPAQPSLLWLPHLFLAIALMMTLLLFLIFLEAQALIDAEEKARSMAEEPRTCRYKRSSVRSNPAFACHAPIN